MSEIDLKELINQAQSFLATDNYKEAIVYADKALALENKSIDAYLVKGNAYANLEDYENALLEFTNASKLDKNNGEIYFHIGNVNILKGDRNTGFEYYTKAISNNYDNSQIYYNMALMYEEDGEIELAIRNYSKASLKDPMRIDARLRKAQLYINDDKNQEALQTLDEIQLIDPDLFDVYHMKAFVYASMNRYDDSIKMLEEGSKLFPKDPMFKIDEVEMYILSGDIDSAKKVVEEIKNVYEMSDGEKRRLALEEARIYASDNDLDKIVEVLSNAPTADKEDMDSSEILFLLMNCYYDKKEYQNAADIAKQLKISVNSQFSGPALYMEPAALLQMGKEAEAMELFKEAVSVLRSQTLSDPSRIDLYLYRAMCLKDMKEYDKATDIIDYALKVDPDLSQAHAIKASILYGQGFEEEAIKEKELAEKMLMNEG